MYKSLLLIRILFPLGLFYYRVKEGIEAKTSIISKEKARDD